MPTVTIRLSDHALALLAERAEGAGTTITREATTALELALGDGGAPQIEAAVAVMQSALRRLATPRKPRKEHKP